MFKEVERNIKYFKEKLGNSVDIADKVFSLSGTKVGIIYLKSLTNPKLLAEIIFQPLNNFKKPAKLKLTLDYIAEKLIKSADIEVFEKNKTANEQITRELLNGKAVLFLENQAGALLVDGEQVVTRAPSEPPTSAVIYGRVRASRKALSKICLC